MERAGSTSTSSRLFWTLAAVALAWGIGAALRLAWTCDDAFISFRYAKNLVEGRGLVFNAGERVEGFSNPLWTLWCALGLKVGADVETWAIAWGLVFHAGSLLLLARRAALRARPAAVLAAALPIAALGAAAHPDWSTFATSGLETSLFTFLGLLGFTLMVESDEHPARLAWAGGVFGLAAVTRPEGALLGAAAATFLWVARPKRRRELVGFVAPWAALVVAQLVARIAYYGDVFPNTYYAKSAATAWYAQGWTYTRLYFERYGVLGAGVVAAGVLLVTTMRERRSPWRGLDAWSAEAGLALTLAIVQTAFVVRVGGDFMFARLLVPATPFFLILAEMALERLLPPRREWALAAGLGLALAVAWAPHPLAGGATVAGIVDERLQYPPEKTTAQRRKGETLRRYFAGQPVKVAFMGSEARVVYYSEVATAIECSAGLTDRFIARRPLVARGRVGHEKRPTAAYLLNERGVQLGLHAEIARELGLGDSSLAIPIRFGAARACVLRWDGALIDELVRRGAQVATPS